MPILTLLPGRPRSTLGGASSPFFGGISRCKSRKFAADRIRCRGSCRQRRAAQPNIHVLRR